MRNETLQAKQRLQNDIANMLMEFERDQNVSVREIDVYSMNHELQIYINAPFRCRYYEVCNLKSPTSRTCNNGGGNYCGMYRRLSRCDSHE